MIKQVFLILIFFVPLIYGQTFRSDSMNYISFGIGYGSAKTNMFEFNEQSYHLLNMEFLYNMDNHSVVFDYKLIADRLTNQSDENIQAFSFMYAYSFSYKNFSFIPSMGLGTTMMSFKRSTRRDIDNTPSQWTHLATQIQFSFKFDPHTDMGISAFGNYAMDEKYKYTGFKIALIFKLNN